MRENVFGERHYLLGAPAAGVEKVVEFEDVAATHFGDVLTVEGLGVHGRKTAEEVEEGEFAFPCLAEGGEGFVDLVRRKERVSGYVGGEGFFVEGMHGVGGFEECEESAPLEFRVEVGGSGEDGDCWNGK